MEETKDKLWARSDKITHNDNMLNCEIGLFFKKNFLLIITKMKFNLKSFMEGSRFCYQHFNIGSMSKNVFYQNIGAINSIHF